MRRPSRRNDSGTKAPAAVEDDADEHVRTPARRPPAPGVRCNCPASSPAARWLAMSNNAVPEQLKSGELDRLTRGETAKKIQLADQYRMSQQGDVARRLELQNARGTWPREPRRQCRPVPHGIDIGHGYVHHPNFYHGVVSPAYASHCLQYHYWGPAFFAGLCWYPQVESVGGVVVASPLPPFWDPRPIWCRPVIYDPCPAMGLLGTPVLVPLPVVACGTWVDLQPVVAGRGNGPATGGGAVRRSGPSRGKVGAALPRVVPQQRQLNRSCSRSTSCCLPAMTTGWRPTCRRPACGSTAIEAGDTQSVDIRLPVEVYTMGRDAQGRPAPFTHAPRAGRCQSGGAGNDADQQRRTADPGRDSAGRSGRFRGGSRRRQARPGTGSGRRRFWAGAGPGFGSRRPAGIAGGDSGMVRPGRALDVAESRRSSRRPRPR